MTRLIARVTALEGRRPVVCQVEDMTDGELTRVITGHASTVISDEQLQHIAHGGTWTDLKNV
jgi:hypothetical protein